MRQRRHAIAALFIGACAPAALVAPAFAQTCACAPGGGYVIQADEPPPPLPEYDQPPLPVPGYYWTPGYWAWNNYDYYWVPGVWVEPPQPGLLWTPGYWAFGGGVYAFTPGYWGPHVGFYGGIDYGYGYNGAGYFGGRWDNGRYFYNSAVNNLGPDHVTNVYNQTIVNSATVNRVSFNGGAGGIAAKPTNEELLAEKEAHLQPTRLQVDHARSASMRGEQFVSTNRGKPAIAATPRPGEFKGKGAVPAKSAQETPAPGGIVQPESKEKPPAAEKPVKPEAAPNLPKVERKPPAVEKLVKPEVAPNAPRIEQRPPAVEKPVKPEPPNGAQRAPERPPAPDRKPPQPERKPEAKECGRPGLPPCPR